MAVKYILAGLICAGLAGGAVYYGTESLALEDNRSDNSAIVESNDTTAEPQDTTATSIVDRLLKNPKSDETEIEDNDGESSDLADETDIIASEEDVATDIMMSDPDEDVITDTASLPEDVEADVVTLEPKTPPVDYDTLRTEADQIGIIDRRDEAYLNILDFALSKGDIKTAEELVESLSSPDRRDAARQRIGIAHARAGRLDAAFAVIETLEIDQEADSVRLEIIRAATEQN